jgi:hypothetical protein
VIISIPSAFRDASDLDYHIAPIFGWQCPSTWHNVTYRPVLPRSATSSDQHRK